jgi:hypothetical protein
LPQDDTSVVVLTSAPSALIQAGDSQPSLPVGKEEIDEQGVHAIVQLGNGEQVQLLTTALAPVAAVIPLDLDGFDRLQAVHRLLAGLHGRVIPPDTRITHQQRARARRMLRTFDGFRDGATQQDIAQTLFRTGDLNRDEWQASSARHAIKSLLRDARVMIAGGYRRLLRHTRRT